MGVIAYVLLVVLVGVLVWLAITYVPMPDQFKKFLPIAAIILLVLILLVEVFGIGPGHDVAIPRLR